MGRMPMTETGESPRREGYDLLTDVLVVGSGGGGMTAALVAKDRGCDVLLVEKGLAFGGSTAMSGGTIWIPRNHLMMKAGLLDSAAEAMDYLRDITGGSVPEERLRAYVAAGPEMAEYLEKHSRVRFMITPGTPDYYPDVRGSKLSGRSVEPVPIDIRMLGRQFGSMREYRVVPRVSLTAREARRMLNSSLLGRLQALRVMIPYLVNPRRSFGKGDTRLTLGNALVARLRLSLADRNVPVWLESPAKTLIVDGQGRVIGIEVATSGNVKRIRARRAVILAAGGFSHNQAMREEYQQHPVSGGWSVACPDNAGDAIRMGLAAGAAVDLMDDSWWCSTSLVPGWPRPMVAIFERNLPGSIMVNGEGRRFTNEAGPYSDVVKAQYASHQAGRKAVPAYLIMDSRFRSRYPAGPLMPKITPKKFIDRGYVKVADTLEDLALRCGIDPQGLAAEVAGFNRNAAEGKDPGFKRGESPIDRIYGDPSVKPNPCLRPLERPPFYAIAMWPGDIGTKGGLQTDARARVLRPDGTSIEGLYATGNCSSSVMGHTYPGAGATIGASMVFGYIAALDASRTAPAIPS